MPRLKLTKTAVAKLAAPDPSGRQVLHWDTELKGFGVLCSSKTNARTFVVQRDINGKTRRVTVGPVNVLSLDDARQRAQLVLAEMFQGVDPKAKREAEAEAEQAAAFTLRDGLDLYLEDRKDLRPKTRHDYQRFLERYLPDWLDRRLREITPELVAERHQAIQAKVAERAETRMSKGNSAANFTMRVLRLIWNHAAEHRPELILSANPVRRLRRSWYKEPPREDLVRTADLPRFYEAVAALPNAAQRDYLLTVLFTGLRRNEAAALRWEDVDFRERMIRLAAARTKADRKLDLPMSDFLHDLLVARRAVDREGPLVFPANSASGHVEEPKFALAQVERATGIKVTVHGLRRTFVTVAESCDISVYALKGLVNHSLGRDVTAGYIVAGPERLRAPMQKVADRLKELAGIVGPDGGNVVRIGEA